MMPLIVKILNRFLKLKGLDSKIRYSIQDCRLFLWLKLSKFWLKFELNTVNLSILFQIKSWFDWMYCIVLLIHVCFNVRNTCMFFWTKQKDYRKGIVVLNFEAISIMPGPKAGFKFTLVGALLPRAWIEPTSYCRH